uniref:Armadillo repeat-containing protein 8 n=1 Tax=Chromera velia CCMP2878 TaxID=1169474 RepID=A0A0G4HWE2_9ALVE|eukprot:Cvel_9023.t1-p1 / transcript=Cvel_9023.t1 / gene=Cvel_9023 / organism=Chromera_velia_CCMP2878 / gene_product=hypothetical protein / transcript_product=hypothetical protein / location=Cvel_scaffold511:48235-51755(+) / protein_length=380 / sequence_SO=supercontig / SO=protein_coding / is_pseudo=false
MYMTCEPSVGYVNPNTKPFPTSTLTHAYGLWSIPQLTEQLQTKDYVLIKKCLTSLTDLLRCHERVREAERAGMLPVLAHHLETGDSAVRSLTAQCYSCIVVDSYGRGAFIDKEKPNLVQMRKHLVDECVPVRFFVAKALKYLSQFSESAAAVQSAGYVEDLYALVCHGKAENAGGKVATLAEGEPQLEIRETLIEALTALSRQNAAALAEAKNHSGQKELACVRYVRDLFHLPIGEGREAFLNVLMVKTLDLCIAIALLPEIKDGMIEAGCVGLVGSILAESAPRPSEAGAAGGGVHQDEKGCLASDKFTPLFQNILMEDSAAVVSHALQALHYLCEYPTARFALRYLEPSISEYLSDGLQDQDAVMFGKKCVAQLTWEP